MQTLRSSATWVTVLAAHGRAAEIPETADAYGWLIGSWELDVCRYWGKDVSAQGIKGEAHFGWVLEGRAVQDVWIMPRRADRTANLDKTMNMYGTTLRGTRGVIERLARCIEAGRADGSLPTAPDAQTVAVALYQSWLGASLLAKITRDRAPLDTAMAGTRQLLGLAQTIDAGEADEFAPFARLSSRRPVDAQLHASLASSPLARANQGAEPSSQTFPTPQE